MLCYTFASAYAQEPKQCADSDFVLKTSEGIIGGANLELDEETQVSVFSDGACLEAEGIRLQAPEIRWDGRAGMLTVKNLEAQTSRYRFRATSGSVKGQVFSAQGVTVTTCRCGEDLRVLAEQARFNTQSGNILFEQAGLELYSLELARLKHYQLDTRKPPSFGLPTVSSGVPGEPETILIPIVLGLGNGLDVGLRDFPLLGNESGPNTSFTLVGYDLGSSEQQLRFGVALKEAEANARLEVASKAGQFYFYSTINKGPFYYGLDSEKQLYTARLHKTFREGNLSVVPFAAGTSELEQRENLPKITSTGLSLGSEIRYTYQLRQGAFRVRLEPSTLFTLYDAAPFYWTYGGLVEVRYDQGFSLRLAYEHSQNFENRDSQFSFERRDPKSLISLGFSYQPIGLKASYDFLNFETRASLRYGLGLGGGELWGQGNIRFTGGTWTQQELVLGYNPAPLDCTYSYSLSPKLGYDLLRNGISRAGLEFRYADCCFIWKLGFEAVFLPQTPDPKDDPGKFVFGIEIR